MNSNLNYVIRFRSGKYYRSNQQYPSVDYRDVHSLDEATRMPEGDLFYLVAEGVCDDATILTYLGNTCISYIPASLILDALKELD